MWTSSITSFVPGTQPGTIDMSIRYTNGTTTKDVPYTISEPNSYFKIASDQINEYTRLDAVAAILAAPPIGAITFPTAPAPTQAQIDLNTVQRAENVVALVYYLKQLGWITGTETPVTDLKAKILPLLAANVPKLYS